MSKIDKLLYGGFAAVALAGIVAMLVSVFSPPKQIAEEETIETPTPPEAEPATTETALAEDEIMPPEGYVAYWLDDEGNKVWLTQEEVDEGLAAAEEQRRKEAEQKAKELAEKEWLASKQDWIDRFPFQPTHHPEITFDPEAYDPNEARPTNEKDDAYWEMLELVDDHEFLRNFYESHLLYTEEFEQFYDIIHRELGEMADNAILLGWTFDHLKRYHQAMAKDPESIRWKNVQRTIQPPMPELLPSMLESLTPAQFAVYRALPGEARREMTKELRHNRDQEMLRRIENYHNSFTTVTVDVTWGEEAQKRKDSMIAELLRNVQPDRSWLSREQSTKIQEHLLNEIPAEGFLEMPETGFAYSTKYMKELKPGDPLLIK